MHHHKASSQMALNKYFSEKCLEQPQFSLTLHLLFKKNLSEQNLTPEL